LCAEEAEPVICEIPVMRDSVQSRNEYVLDLYSSYDIRNVSKLIRVAWVEYAACMVEMRTVYQVYFSLS